jgi:hypothetical protein
MNLYKEMCLGLKGEEWRKPGLVALAAELARSAGEHKPIDVQVPASYVPKTGANPWACACDDAGDGAGDDARTVPQESSRRPFTRSLPRRWRTQSRGRVSMGAARQVPPPIAAASSPRAASMEVKLGSTSQQASADFAPDSAVQSPKSRLSLQRRLPDDVLDERSCFGTCGSRDSPPTSRLTREESDNRIISGRTSRQLSCAESDDASSCSSSSVAVVGRARGNSVVDDSSACWLTVRPSSSQGACPTGVRV